MAECGSPLEHLVCQECYDTIFSAEGWQTVMADGRTSDNPEGSGYKYTTTWSAIKKASKICNWSQVTVRYYKDTGYTPAGDKFLAVVVKGLGNGGNAAANVIKARDRITQLWTEKSFGMAKALHRQDSSILADRVIDCADSSEAKIVLTNGQIYGSYLTLSYVWGGPQPMPTTKNVDKYTTDGLEMSDFPQSIRDAVTVTGGVGQRYLRVDALCILQDSPEDKVTQLGKMHAIYKNSYLTINASRARSTHEGFLHQPRPQRKPRTTILFPCPGGTAGTVLIAYRSPWDELEPITWRGWCYQEKVLPARSLLYASDTLKYYCQTETVSIGEALCEESTGLRLPHGTYPSASAVKCEADAVRFRQSWLAALFQYTLRSITVPSDRLPAFGAVAEQFSIVSQDRYLAGLWRKTLLLDLLWTTHDRCERPKTYRAPSWSWASVNGLIRAEWRFDQLAKPQDTKDARDLRMATVVDCRVIVASPLAPYGEVTEGLLTLSGVLFRVHSDGGTAEQSITLTSGSESRAAGFIPASRDTTEDWADMLYTVPLLWSVRGSFMFGLVIG
ncbi:heterokaryon incompatibility protein-domain-containing protein [Nemania sp. NC0429]|nr:heterokaryon incompatibility protein-domain-containing protein [Nemania sp. NC0429]